ncbi:MAG: 50S ribosomal protein L2 [bacterium]
MKRHKPTTPGRRQYVSVDRSLLSKKRPEKSLTEFRAKKGGRNNYGRITVRGQGGGHKRLYRRIDFKRDKDNATARVECIEYDPNRSAYIALLVYADGEKRYIIAPRDLNAGMVVQSGSGSPIRIGNNLPLEEIPTGATVHNIELKPGKGGQICRGAGTSARLGAKENGYALINLPSGQGRWVNLKCRATIGSVGNAEHINRSLGKAGRSRHLNKRPITRGMAQNPVDHPLGGGEGRGKGGHPRSPSGRWVVGQKTRKNKRTDRFVVKKIRE